MTTETLTIVVIDDHPLFRKGAADLIAMHPSLRLVGEASGGEQGLAVVLERRPDMVLLDLNMKGSDGLQTLKGIKAADLDCRVIILTVSDSEEDVVAALRAGADGYLLKDTEPEELLERVLAAAEGQFVIGDSVAALIARALREEVKPRSPEDAGLTDRETQILGLIADGLSNKLIARRFNISEGTVKVHVKHVLKKLNLRSRVEAAVWAVRRG
jgi:two-component system nitrate/nitrite response regulator NarL